MLTFEVEYDKEVRNRIRLSVAAYAYEYCDDSIMSDEEFDKLSLEIEPDKKTGRVKLDNFFRKHFEPSTGMWIRKHPEKHKLKSLYEAYYLNNM